MTYGSLPAPLLALRTVTFCTENEWTPRLPISNATIGAPSEANI
jgi:hypothetical protein